MMTYSNKELKGHFKDGQPEQTNGGVNRDQGSNSDC